MAAAAAIGLTAQAAEINGAGATFPYPIYAKWAEAYAAKTGVKLNYQSIGSGGGIAQINARTVDFGASDMPLKPEELEKSGLTQFPPVVGGEVMVVNLPGIQPGRPGKTGEGDARVQAYNFRMCMTDLPANRIPWPKPEGSAFALTKLPSANTMSTARRLSIVRPYFLVR